MAETTDEFAMAQAATFSVMDGLESVPIDLLRTWLAETETRGIAHGSHPPPGIPPEWWKEAVVNLGGWTMARIARRTIEEIEMRSTR